MSMISRTFASVFPRQSPSSLIFSSINAEADSAGTGLFKYSSQLSHLISCAQRNLQPPQVEASSGSPVPHINERMIADALIEAGLVSGSPLVDSHRRA
jgi:hypothetical protein